MSLLIQVAQGGGGVTVPGGLQELGMWDLSLAKSRREKGIEVSAHLAMEK